MNSFFCSVIVYHRIFPKESHWPLLNSDVFVKEEIFKKQIDIISRKFNAITIDQLVNFLNGKEDLPPRAVLITFDDGYLDNYLYAWPILKKYNLPFVFSVVTDFIDGEEYPWWDILAEALEKESGDFSYYFNGIKKIIKLNSFKNKKEIFDDFADLFRDFSLEDQKKYLYDNSLEKIFKMARERLRERESIFVSWEQLRQMVDSGKCFLASHSSSHPIIGKLDAINAEKEIIDSKKIIEEKIGSEVKIFCVPFGKRRHFSRSNMELIKNNYQACLINERGRVDKETSCYEIPRLSPSDGAMSFNNILLDRRNIFIRIINGLEKRWINK